MINQRDIIDWKQKRMEGYESGPEIPLIQSQNIDHQAFGESSHREEIVEELKRQLRLALPLIAVSFLQYCLQVISIMFVGHLGELPLSSASIATSLASVTGFSVLVSVFCSSYYLISGLLNLVRIEKEILFIPNLLPFIILSVALSLVC